MGNYSFKIRIRFLATCVFIFACILILKLFFVQIVHKNSYAEKADRQYASPTGDMFNRGIIYMTKRNGDLLASATVMTGFKLAIKPKDIKDAEDVYAKLVQIVPTINHDEFIQKAGKKNDPYEEIANHLSRELADEISALRLPGVSLYKEKWRFYPGSTLASNTLGFVAYKGDDRVGQYGLEKFYNKILAKPKDEAYLNFFAEVFSDIGKNFSGTREGDVVTTLDPATQDMLDKQMKDVYKKWSADEAGAIIMDPKTGEIYAMSVLPNFDLNNFGSVKDPRIYGNPLVENVFEFGSVIKPLVVASALDAKVITRETTYYDGGKVIVNKKEINNFDKKGRGTVNMQEVLNQSLNTGMVFIENKLGHDKFRKYMKGYGIGEKTGIDLPNETSGLVKNLDSKIDVDYATASFGQGIAVTPVEAIRAFAVIANGGMLVTPHLAKSINYDDGTSKTLDYPIMKKDLISKDASETITRMLVHVFDNAYGGGKYKFEHYSVATKTGTAQVARPDGKGYYEDRHMHSFFGYFPAYDPKFVVFMFLKNPKGASFAAETLIPPFVETSKFLFNYYNITPDR